MIYKFDKETLTFRKIRKFWLFLPYALLVVMTLFSIFGFTVLTQEVEKEKQEKEILENALKINTKAALEEKEEKRIRLRGQKLTIKNLWTVIKGSRVKYPYVVMAQAMLESGMRTTNDNNLFGMTYPYTRPTTTTGKNSKGWAKYTNWELSVIDYVLWQQEFLKSRKISNETEYLASLGAYAEAPDYRNVIKRMLPELKRNLN